MEIFKIENDWIELKGLSSKGKRVKCWLENPDGNIFLFKIPRIRKDNLITCEIWTETVAYKIGSLLNLPVPEVIPAIYKDEYGVLIRSFLSKADSIFHAEELFSSVDSESIKLIKPAPKSIEFLSQFLKTASTLSGEAWSKYKKMLIYDCLIGNQDRHHENWGFIGDTSGSKADITPYYDNANCFGPVLSDEEVIERINDEKRFKSFISKSGHPDLYFESTGKKCRHFSLMEFLLEESDTVEIIQSMLNVDYCKEVDLFINEIMNIEGIDEKYKLTGVRATFIMMILKERKNRLQEILNVYIQNK